MKSNRLLRDSWRPFWIRTNARRNSRDVFPRNERRNVDATQRNATPGGRAPLETQIRICEFKLRTELYIKYSRGATVKPPAECTLACLLIPVSHLSLSHSLSFSRTSSAEVRTIPHERSRGNRHHVRDSIDRRDFCVAR